MEDVCTAPDRDLRRSILYLGGEDGGKGTRQL